MKSPLSTIFATALLAGALGAGGAAHAASVTLTGWAFGSGPQVRSSFTTVDSLGTGSSAPRTRSQQYNGQGGAFIGKLSGTAGFDLDTFITYCIELTEQFSFSPKAMTGYSVVNGASYFAARHGDAGIADRLGQLMTWVAGDAARVDTAAESASLQLAIWNTIYDTDHSLVTRSGTYSDVSTAASYANTLLAGAATVERSRFQVFALERSGKQDFLLLRQVPEPSSLALAALALTGLGVAYRRRKA